MGITPGPERGPVGNIEICLIAFVNEMSIFSIYIYFQYFEDFPGSFVIFE